MELVTAVIITCKRPPQMVKRAIDSVIRQTYSEIELIVVDDSPSDYPERDAVRQLLNGMPANVRYVAHEKNMGACAARNTGIKNAAGEYISFLDDDDEWLPEKIEKEMAVFHKENSPDLALVYCNCLILYEESGKKEISPRVFHKGKVFEELMLSNFIGTTSFPLIKKAALEAVHGFDVEQPSGQDYDVWLRLAQKYDVDYVEDPLVLYHWHEGEQISKNPQKSINGILRINEKHKDYLSAHKRAWWINTSKLINEYARNDELLLAIKTWWKVAFACPNYIRDNVVLLAKMLRAYSLRIKRNGIS